MFELRLSRLRLSESSRAPGNELPWIRASYDTFQEFVAQTASNLSESAIFLRTVIELPLETTVRLDVGMQSGPVLIRAVGEIAQVTPGTDRDRNPGLLVSFLYLDPASARLIDSIRRRRHELEATATAATAYDAPPDYGLTTRPMPAMKPSAPEETAGAVPAADVSAGEDPHRELRESLASESEIVWEVEVESLLSQVKPTPSPMSPVLAETTEAADLPSPFEDAPSEGASETGELEPSLATGAGQAPPEEPSADAAEETSRGLTEDETADEIRPALAFDELETWPPPRSDPSPESDLETLAVPFVEPVAPPTEAADDAVAEAEAVGETAPGVEDGAAPPPDQLPALHLEELGEVVSEPDAGASPTRDERAAQLSTGTWGTMERASPFAGREDAADSDLPEDRLERIRQRRAELDRRPAVIGTSVAMSASRPSRRRPALLAAMALAVAVLVAAALLLLWRGDLDALLPASIARGTTPAGESARPPADAASRIPSPSDATPAGAREATPGEGEPSASAPASEPRTNGEPAAGEPAAGNQVGGGEAAAAPGDDTAAGASGPASTAEEVAAAVRGWAAAWSRQNVDDYLASYAGDYAPPGRARSGWEAERRTRVRAPRRIEVSIDDLEVEMAGADRALATFRQLYRTETVNLRTWKTLEMVREPSGWKIAGEQRIDR